MGSRSSVWLKLGTLGLACAGACTNDYDFVLAYAPGAGGGAGPSASASAAGAAGGTAGTGDNGGAAGAPMDCGPCEIPHAKPACEGSACIIGSCEPGYDNCNAAAADGCEKMTAVDVEHCGACERACDTTGVSVAACVEGLCVSACALGHANCNQPTADAPDDGCELDVTSDTAHCGGCGNDCGSQGFGSRFVCESLVCRCTSSDQCKGSGAGTAVCDDATGKCACDGVVCQQGEACDKAGSSQVCSCNGGPACTEGLVCCQTPEGCKDLATDAESCGACGHACDPAQQCVSGTCR